MSNEKQMDPPDERKAWTKPCLERLGTDMRDVDSTKIPHRPKDADDHTPPTS